MQLRLVKTCGACPEQYDVFLGDDQIGYLRLRHGTFRADYRGGTVYVGHPDGDGIFTDSERHEYLNAACHAIITAHEQSQPDTELHREALYAIE